MNQPNIKPINHQIVIKTNKATVLTVRKHLHFTVRGNLVGTQNHLICVGTASVLAVAKGQKMVHQ